MADMCPHCGERVRVSTGLTVLHDSPPVVGDLCPGSMQYPRCAESDARPLWNGEPNTRFQG